MSFVTKQLSHLSDLDRFDMIVNCSGLGATDLVCDSCLIPIRGEHFTYDIVLRKHVIIQQRLYTIITFL